MRAIQYLSSFLVALIVSAGILPAVIRLAHRTGAVDRPDGRRVHQGEIPRLGGIGIFLGFLAGVGVSLLLAGRADDVTGDPINRAWYGSAVGLGVIFLAGLLDDLRQFRPQTKLALQVLAAGIAVSTGLAIEGVTSPFGGTIELGILGPVAAFAWILLVTNAINLMDGLDGLAGGLSLIVTTTVACVALAMDQFAAVICGVALAGALMGFLRYNFEPARIFMGDAGSQFLGFALAVISLRGSQKGPTAVAIMVPLLVMGVPLLEVATTVGRRMLSGERGSGRYPLAVLRRVSQADRGHLHHNLLDLGFSPRKTVLALYLVGALFALAAYSSLASNSLAMAGFVLMLSIGCVALVKIAILDRRDQARVRTEAAEATANLTSRLP